MTFMTKRGENIYLRKDGRWEGRYVKGKRPDGTTKFGYVYGQKYTDVKNALCILKAKMQQSNIPASGLWTFYVWAEYWLDAIAKPDIKESTYESYRNQIDLHLKPYFGETPLAAIDHDTINRFISHLKEYLAGSTVCGVYRLLKSILLSAIRKKMMPPIAFDQIKKPKDKGKSPRVLTRLEQNKLEKEIFKLGYDEFLLGLYAGLRLGEICALQWHDVDFENATMHIDHSVKRIKIHTSAGLTKTRLIVSETKSESSNREIPISPFLMQRLKMRHEDTDDTDGFVFPGRNGYASDPRTLQKRLSRLVEKAGLNGVHMHTLRHSFATRCLEESIGIETLCDFLGHSSPEITWRYYAHCTLEHKAEAISRLQPIGKPKSVAPSKSRHRRGTKSMALW